MKWIRGSKATVTGCFTEEGGVSRHDAPHDAGIGPLCAEGKVCNGCKLIDRTMLKADYSPLGGVVW